jgi:hypothetical protein
LTAPIPEPLVERMVALVRGIHASGSLSYAKEVEHLYIEACEIAATLAPDMAAIREIFAEEFPESLSGAGPDRARLIAAGQNDDFWEMRVARKAFEAGRSFERKAGQ